MTPEQQHTAMSLGGRIGANRRWATEGDRTQATESARQQFMSRFEREVDPDGVLPGPERTRRAESLRKAYFSELALLSARARRNRGECGMSHPTEPTDEDAEEQAAMERATQRARDAVQRELDR